MKQIHSFMRFWTITGLVMMCALSIKAQVASSLNSFITDNIYSPVFNPAASPAFGTSRDFLPVSPTAGSLGVFGQIPVGNYTGTADISIPLYEIKYKELSVPISINYHTSGLKPDLFPGPVGLGWAFQAGGAISRVIKGYPDMGDYPGSDKILLLANQRGENDWYNLTKLSNYLRNQEIAFTNNNEPDEYYFNINGQSGKFYVDHRDTFRIQSTQGHSFKIVMQSEERKDVTFVELPQVRTLSYIDRPYSNKISLSKVLTGFTMIDENGIKYSFGGTEKAIEFSRPGLMEYVIYSESYVSPTTWYLTSIESPNGYKILFDYEQQTAITCTYFSDVVLYKLGGNSYYNTAPCANSVEYRKNIMINGCYLTQITFPTGKVTIDNSLAKEQLDFNFGSQYYESVYLMDFIEFKYYTDVVAANTEKIRELGGIDELTPHKIDAIHVYDNGSNIIRDINFIYNNNVNQRLKLNRVQVGTGSETIQKYTFEYNNRLLPPYNARETDMYGYWNGKGQFSEVASADFFEYMRSHPDYLSRLKMPNPEYLQAEILNKIIYPTGGYTLFEYEPHEYGCSYHIWPFETKQNPNGNQQTSGVRVKSIRNYDNNNILLSDKRYHYVKDYLSGGTVSSGVLAYTPQFSELYESKRLKDTGRNLNYFFRYSTNPIFSLCNTRGNHVTYSEVTVEEVGNGFSVYKYKNYDNGYADKELLGFISNQLEDISNGSCVDFRVNTEGISMSLERGQLLSTMIYDKDKVRKKQIINAYNDDPERFNEHVRYFAYEPLSINMTGERFHSLSAGVYYTYFPYLKKKTEIDYSAGSVVKEVNYVYDKKYRLLRTVSTMNSNGTVYMENYTYPHDNMNIPIYTKMVQNNLLKYPIKKVITSGNTTNSIYWEFAEGLSSNGNLILPYKILRKYNDSSSDTEITYLNYDYWGNPRGIDYLSEGNNCYLWSYNGMYPVAYIVGATFEEVKTALGEAFINELENSSFPSDAKIQDIRVLLSGLNVLVTTYTYAPLIGVTSIVYPNGIKETYKYDTLGRLLYIKDNQNKLIKEHIYHYTN